MQALYLAAGLRKGTEEIDLAGVWAVGGVRDERRRGRSWLPGKGTTNGRGCVMKGNATQRSLLMGRSGNFDRKVTVPVCPLCQTTVAGVSVDMRKTAPWKHPLIQVLLLWNGLAIQATAGLATSATKYEG